MNEIKEIQAYEIAPPEVKINHGASHVFDESLN